MLYTVTKGQEHKLKISSDIHAAEELMYPAFQQALTALEEIVVRAKAFDRGALCSELYGYSQNIIAFSGRRGQGKTSTMVTCSNAMSKGIMSSNLSDCAFEVLPPIDPTIMNGEQNILGVILSRMYRLAENKWENHCGGNSFSLCGPTEAQKNDLLELFQKCLSGLNAIYNDKYKATESLREFNKLSDSSLLKRNIYDLTSQLLTFIAGETKKQSFLVIQLDDTDFQVQMGYQLLEDLRKFFTIPNVIILMATDMKMLRSVILQYFLREFEDNLVYGFTKTKELESIVSKYLDKLIPPTHVVHLPKLDDCMVRYGRRMSAKYDDGNGKNLLVSEAESLSGVTISAQPQILRYIYRKTGIVFVASDGDFHGIIPTTLRGLGQLLSLLSSMPDVPKAIPTDAKTTPEYVEYVKSRVAILETNLLLFESYFLNEWLNAKLPALKADVIKKLSEIDAEERIRYVMRQLKELYTDDPQHETETPKDLAFADFLTYLRNLERNHRDPEDLCFYFSIRTTFTILFHKAALRQERIAVDEHDPQNLLVFDFSPETINIPDTYCLPSGLSAGDHNLVAPLNSSGEDKIPKGFVRGRLYRYYYANPLSGETSAVQTSYFSFMHFITLVLSLGSKEGQKLLNKDLSQSWLYAVQMSSLAVATNLDVQEYIYTTSAEEIIEPALKSHHEVLQILFRHIDRIVGDINTEKAGYPQMISSNIAGILDCLISNRIGSYIFEIEQCYSAVENILGPTHAIKFDALIRLYKNATEVKKDLVKAESDHTFIPSAMEHFYQFILFFDDLSTGVLETTNTLRDGHFVLQSVTVDSDLEKTHEFVTAKAFWDGFKRVFRQVCQRNKTTIAEVRQACRIVANDGYDW